MKGILTIVLVILIYSPLYSQYLVGPKITYGYSKFNDAREVAMTTGKSEYASIYGIGGVFNFAINHRYALHLEGNFNKRIKKTNSIEYSNNHIEIPALLRFSFKVKSRLTRNFQVYINGGPYISYWLSGKATIHSPDKQMNIRFSGSSDENNLRVDGNRVQFGLGFGGGLMIPTSAKQSLMIDLRYYAGQTYIGGSIDESPGSYEIKDNLKGTYQIVNVSLAYLFNIDVVPSKKGKSTMKVKNRRR